MAFSNRPTLGATRARQGRLGRHVLWVLLVGTLLAALALFAAWTWRSGDLAASNSNNGGPSSSSKTFNAPEPAAVQNSNQQTVPTNPK